MPSSIALGTRVPTQPKQIDKKADSGGNALTARIANLWYREAQPIKQAAIRAHAGAT